ncbi:MAG: EamA family transporter RarD [Bacillota bacterium]
MKPSINIKDENTAGVCYGIAAYSLWGILPLYWKLMESVPALEILAHRICWSFIFMLLVVYFYRKRSALSAIIANRKKLFLIFLCGFIVSANWFTYIYAVNSGHVIESSMGYFINPLVVVLLGVTVLHEHLGRWQLVAIILAFVGVLIITIQYGRIPWIALILAGTFALYGLIKKIIHVDSLAGLVLETLIVMPIALTYIVFLEKGGQGSLGSSAPAVFLTLAGTGVITAIPLIFYARGIERTTFSMMGFLQYIAPTLQLFLGIFIFKEYFSFSHFISFCFIWVALVIFTLASANVLKDRSTVGHKVEAVGMETKKI